MKISRKAVAILLAGVVLVFALVVISLNSLIDRNRDLIVQEIQKSLGRSVTFEQLRLDLWGGLGLSVKQLRVAEDQHFAATPFIQTKEMKMQLRWLPLLLGRIEIRTLNLDEPEIQIIRNEERNLNLSTLAAPDKETKEPQREAEEKNRRSALRFLVSAVHVANGKIHYVDRSSKEPVEVRARNVDLDLGGLTLTGKSEIKLAANLFEGQAQNVSVEGRIGPFQKESDWAQQPVDLHLRADPLLLPQITRAIPSLREKADLYLGITGPVALKARFLGTFQKPRITDLSFTGAVFGSTKNNASASGELDFSSGASWSDGKIKAKVAVDPVSLDQLRKLPAVKRALPSALLWEGPISVTADLQGPLDDLKVLALMKASQSDIQYGDWFKKAKGTPGEIAVKGQRQKDRIIFEESTLTIHNTKLLFSGLFEARPARRLTLKLRSEGTNLSGWDQLLPALSSYSPSGNLRLDLSVKKDLGPGNGNLDIQGKLNLADVQLKDKKDGRSIEKMAASISFRGREARVDNGALRLGSSDLAFEATASDLSQPVIRYTLRSPKLNLGDLPGLAAYKTDEMKTLQSTGELDVRKGKTSLRGNITSPEGVFQELPYRNLRGDITWSSGNLSFRNLSLQALNGTLRGTGEWEARTQNSQRLSLETHIDGVDLKSLLTQKFPKFKDNMEGRLNLNAKLRGASKNSSSLQENLQGEGDSQVRNGLLKDFNLIELVMSKISALPGMSNLISSRLSSRYSAMFKRQDTPFDTLSATFTVEQGRVQSKDLLMVTPDYSISGDGWGGFDKTIKWNATLVMSPQFSQDLMQEHKNVRYMLDRQGRLAIPFRLEGTLPHVQAKPDVEKLAEAIQRGLLTRGMERALGGEKDQGEKDTKKKPTRDLIQKGLEQLFKK